MALDNINLLSSSALSPNSDKILLYRSGGLEASTTLLSLTNSALNLIGVYLDPVNQRMGIGTNSPLATAHIKGIGTTSSTTSLLVQNSAGTTAFNIKDNGVTNATYIEGGMCWFNNINSNGIVKFGSSLSVGFNTDPIAQLQIKGSGSTSATTSLLVQNSSGNTALEVKDDLNAVFGQDLQIKGQIAFGGLTIGDSSYYGAKYINLLSSLPGAGTRGGLQWGGGGLCEIVSDRKQPFSQDVTMCFRVKGTEYITIQEVNASSVGTYNVGINNTNPHISAILDVASTTKGFLPPRMTTAQKNLIASPAAGLMIYDTDLNRPCFFNGTSWITL